MKIYKKTVRKYFKYVNWTQPVLTSNTDKNCAVTCSASFNGYPAYYAMDNSTTNCWFPNTTTGWWKIVFPEEINITALTHIAGAYQGQTQSITGRYYADSSKQIPIGNAISGSYAQGASVQVQNIPAEGIKTNTIYFEKTAGHANAGIGQLVITAQEIVESNASNYNTYEDVEVYKLPTKPGRVYYKHLASVTFNMCNVAGTFTSSGWQSSSKGSNYIRGFANAYEKGQNAKVSSAYSWTGVVPAGTYTYNITTTGQGNGYYNNPKVTVTYIDGETEVVFSDIFTGASYNKDFSFEAKKPMVLIKIEGTLTSNGMNYVEVATVLTSKTLSEKTIGSESDHDSYEDVLIYYGIGG